MSKFTPSAAPRSTTTMKDSPARDSIHDDHQHLWEEEIVELTPAAGTPFSYHFCCCWPRPVHSVVEKDDILISESTDIDNNNDIVVLKRQRSASTEVLDDENMYFDARQDPSTSDLLDPLVIKESNNNNNNNDKSDRRLVRQFVRDLLRSVLAVVFMGKIFQRQASQRNLLDYDPTKRKNSGQTNNNSDGASSESNEQEIDFHRSL